MLPLSHEEVVHGKSPMLYKMPGFEYEKFANLRLLYGYMYTHPGAKLLFMGNEFGQSSEWNESSELDWGLLQHDSHKKLQAFVKALSHLYKTIPSLYEYQFDPQGFEWIELNRRGDGVMAYRRKGKNKKDDLLIIVNTSEKKYQNWSMQISGKTQWKELLNSNAIEFWGTGELLNENVFTKIIHKKNTLCEINFDIPALSILIFQ